MVDYAAYKNQRNKIQRKIRKFRPETIIFVCITFLHRRDANTPERLRIYQPWFLMLLIKWTIIHGFYNPSSIYLELTERDIAELINLLNSLGSLIKMPTDYSHLMLWARNMAFQQFWLEGNVTYVRLARQSLLFNYLDSQHKVSKDFFGLTGITINEFILLSAAIITRFISEKSVEYFVTIDWFSPYFRKFSREKIKNFLHLISADLLSVRKYLNEHIKSTKDPNPINEFYEQSPLLRYPLFRYDGKFYCYSPILLANSLQSFISDRLRSSDANRFMSSFGEIFERYVENSIKFTGLTYITEAVLKREFGETSKVVDFIILEKDTNIFIDAKGVEFDYSGMVTQSAEIMRGRTESSILKAIEQSYSVSHALISKSHIADTKLGNRSNFLIVVTFKELFVGNGIDFYESIAQAKIDEIINRYGGTQLIPLEHMYFISADELDLLVSYSVKENRGIVDLLYSATQDDAGPEKKLLFMQHLWKADSSIDQPKYLYDEFHKIYENLVEGLDQKPSS